MKRTKFIVITALGIALIIFLFWTVSSKPQLKLTFRGYESQSDGSDEHLVGVVEIQNTASSDAALVECVYHSKTQTQQIKLNPGRHY